MSTTWKGLRNHVKNAKPSPLTTDLSKAIREARDKLSIHGAPLNERIVVVPRGDFEKVKKHNDTTSGRIALKFERSDAYCERWTAEMPEVGERLNLIVPFAENPSEGGI